MAVRNHQLSIIEATETLSKLADLEYDQEMGIVQNHELQLLGEPIHYKSITWLHQSDASIAISLIREIFRLINYYLLDFYKGEYPLLANHSNIEGIKVLMVLVEEAAKKIDAYSKVLVIHNEKCRSVLDFKEYKNLKEFYHTKISRKTDEGNLSKWIIHLNANKNLHIDSHLYENIPLQLPKLNLKNINRTFINLETIKIDSEYELLYLRKQNGARFFSPRLLRNVKLICDFETEFRNYKKLDLIKSVNFWFDRIAHCTSKQILKAISGQFDLFLKEMRTIKNNEIVDILNKALMALVFASQSRNLQHHQPTKSCAEYFEDFLIFLRNALGTATYKRWNQHPPKKNNTLAWDLIDFLRALCRVLYTNSLGWEEMPEPVTHLLKEGLHLNSHLQAVSYSSESISEQLLQHYHAFAKLLTYHSNGPFLKLIHSIETNALNAFDPLHQCNIPQQLFDLFIHNERLSFIRMPSPTRQQLINNAAIIDEFKAFIQSYSMHVPTKRHLIVNLQDRTSWMEASRCQVLEELQYQSDFMHGLCVVTFPIKTDFYFQVSSYTELENSNSFLEQFAEHLKDGHSGFYFPTTIRQTAINDFAANSFKSIHHFFFSSKENLTREERLNFIEIFYLFLTLKVVDWTQVQTVSLMCKDGLDEGTIHMTLLFIFFKLLEQEWTEQEWKFLDMMLFLPALLVRERLILSETFNRLLLVVKLLEQTKQRLGDQEFIRSLKQEFSPLYHFSIFDSSVRIPHLKMHVENV